MKKSLIVLTAAAGLFVAGCSSNRGGASDQQNPSSNSGTTENPNPNPYPNNSSGMGGTSSDTDNNSAPSTPDSGSQNNGSQSPR